MITLEDFISARIKYGHFASWAIWAQGSTPSENIGDLSVLDPERHPEILQNLKPDLIYVGLNISRPIERPFGNFHDQRPAAKDYKLRFALEGTQYLGGYMTDVIKDFEEKASGQVMSFLSRNRDFEQDNIQLLLDEMRVIGSQNPILIGMGNDAYKILVRNLSDQFKIVKIPHYSAYISKENYRQSVLKSLHEQSF